MWYDTCGTGNPQRWCTTEEADVAHPQTRHRFSSLIQLPNCQCTVTIMQGFTNCRFEHTIQSETKGRTSNILSVIFSFQYILYCQVAQAIKWSIHWWPSSQNRCSKQCLAWYPFQYIVNMLPSTTVKADWSLATTGPCNQGGLHAQCAGTPVLKLWPLPYS
jgi:hypothetical protein